MIIAVYGSLKKGMHNHHWLEDAPMLGDIKVRGTMYLVHNSYPVLMDGDDVHEAEVYDVTDDVYNKILRIEQNAGYAVREIETEFGTANVFYGTDEFENDITNGVIKKISKY